MQRYMLAASSRGLFPAKFNGGLFTVGHDMPSGQDSTREEHNAENPQLYVAFPYHVYGVGKPDLVLAQSTFDARLFHMDHCWGQDGPRPRYWD